MSDQKPNQVEFRYQDRPELPETFCDSVGQWHFDGSTLRIEFLVNRFDEVKAAVPRTARKVPACRMVLTAAGAVELLNECRRITVALEKVGLVKKEQSEKSVAQTN